MRTQPVGGGWLATCDCGWQTYSTTRAVVEQRGKQHLCGGCGMSALEIANGGAA